jgi:hypothetical protein
MDFQTAFGLLNQPTFTLSVQAVQSVLSSRILFADRLFPHPSVWWF